MSGLSRNINEIYGQKVTLYVPHINDPSKDLLLRDIVVIVDESKPLKGEFNNITGYQTGIKILVEDLPDIPTTTPIVKTDNGKTYELGDVIERSKTARWFKAQTTTVTVPVSETPDADFSVVHNGLTVEFTSNAVGDYLYVWDFGDGTTTEGITVSHTYLSAGVYNVLHNAIDPMDNISYKMLDITVSE